jgi:hypothetical protein
MSDASAEVLDLRAQLLEARRRLDGGTRRLSAEQQALTDREAQLDAAHAENCKRRTAMSEMSVELERRRARAYRAEALVAERIGDLEAVERQYRMMEGPYRILIYTPEVYEAVCAIRQRDMARARVPPDEIAAGATA